MFLVGNNKHLYSRLDIRLLCIEKVHLQGDGLIIPPTVALHLDLLGRLRVFTPTPSSPSSSWMYIYWLEMLIADCSQTAAVRTSSP